MTAFATAKPGYCACFAAVCTSAHIGLILDTAILAVSILLVLMIPVLGA